MLREPGRLGPGAIPPIGSIVLSETACRHGSLHFIEAGWDTGFRPFDDLTFIGKWGSQAAYQSCRVQLSETLTARGLYDPNNVIVDVMPEAFPNVISVGASERLPVAILGTANFDVADIVPSSVRIATVSFRGVADNPGNIVRRLTDINADGKMDLVLEFRRDRLPLSENDAVVDVWGSTKGGGSFAGTDVVKIVP